MASENESNQSFQTCKWSLFRKQNSAFSSSPARKFNFPVAKPVFLEASPDYRFFSLTVLNLKSAAASDAPAQAQ
jgi:hypothetical protein